jgi:serine protease
MHVLNYRQAGYVAGLNYKAEAFAAVNDPFVSFQWHFDSIQAQTAWDLSTGAGVVVAVLDTGLAAGSQDGIGCTVSPIDIVNGDNNPADGDGHGTHVSGTVAQTTNNNVGVAGLAHGACVMPVKVLDDAGNGDFADIADGLVYAVNQGARVINMSLGTNARFGVTSIAVMDAALDYAYANGVTVVCASGNDGNRNNVSYPAIYPSTIAVGATDFRNSVPRYSNKGTGLDLVAPGGDLGRDDNGDGYADGVLQETHSGGSWGYYFFQGTSMASPHVAAAAALLISQGIYTSPDQVRSALTCTALDLGSAGYDSASGHGLLQAFAALQFDGNCGGGGGGGCTDADNDGVCVEDGDCDDNNPDVHPGHNDTKGRWGRDGVDNDCNGIIDG